MKMRSYSNTTVKERYKLSVSLVQNYPLLAILIKQWNPTKKWFSQKNHVMALRVN